MRLSIFLFLSILTVFSSTLFVVPFAPAEAGIIPCGLTTDDNNQAGDQRARCTLCHLVVGINSIIVFLRNIMSAVAIAVIVAMAFIYITSAGDEGRMRFAKGGMVAALIGFCIILLAWVIVNFVLTMPIFSGSGSGMIRTGWDSFQCNTTSVSGTGTAGTSSPAAGNPTGTGGPSGSTCSGNCVPTNLGCGTLSPGTGSCSNPTQMCCVAP